MRSLLAMVLAVPLAACASVRPPADDRSAGPTTTLRIAVPAIRAIGGWRVTGWRERLREDATAFALVREDLDGRLRPGLATGWSRRTSPDGAPCWRFRLRRDSWAREVVDDWSKRLSDGDRAILDLLTGVRGVDGPSAGVRPDGLRADGTRLWVCTSRDDPMLPLRIAHPAAWPRITVAEGPRIEVLEVGDPTADVTVRFGSGPAPGRREAGEATRIVGWDPVWALWLNPTARWTADPSFRAWLASSIDREDLAAAAFGEGARAEPVLIPDPHAPHPDAPAVRPFSDGSRPRIEIALDGRDPFARAIGSRLKARLAEKGVEVDLGMRDEPPFDAFGLVRSPAAILFVHRPSSSDPTLALLETLVGLGTAATPFADRLRARPFETGEAREVRARAVQWELLDSARLVPLVRARVFVGGDLGRFEPAAGGHLARREPGSDR